VRHHEVASLLERVGLHREAHQVGDGLGVTGHQVEHLGVALEGRRRVLLRTREQSRRAEQQLGPRRLVTRHCRPLDDDLRRLGMALFGHQRDRQQPEHLVVVRRFDQLRPQHVDLGAAIGEPLSVQLRQRQAQLPALARVGERLDAALENVGQLGVLLHRVVGPREPLEPLAIGGLDVQQLLPDHDRGIPLAEGVLQQHAVPADQADPLLVGLRDPGP